MSDTWRHCYDSGWQGLCVPEAFSHPAKYSRALIQRIYQHLTAEGWLRPGDTVLDPFGGVALGGLDAGLAGVRWIGVELEPRFHALGQDNIALWQRRYGHLPQWVTPTLVQGDSRKLDAILREQVGACVASPPFSPLGSQPTGRGQGVRADYSAGKLKETSPYSTYGTAPGQLGAMPPGQVEAVVSSPPYAETALSGGTENLQQRATGANHYGVSTRTGRVSLEKYGSSHGQLGAMPPSQVEACVSSPPYETSQQEDGRRRDPAHAGLVNHRGALRTNPRRAGERLGLKEYAAQVAEGNLATDHGTTFWAAAKEILAHVLALLKPGGIAVWIVKAYVRDGQIVDFPADWQRLCERLGFVTLHEHHALLVEEHGTQGGLFGEPTRHRTQRKSFFRRLAEAKGSPAIDYEVVLCMQKPVGSGGEGISAAISSPPYVQSVHDGNGIDHTKLTGNRPGPHTQTNAQGYGSTPGQLGAMPAGTPST